MLPDHAPPAARQWTVTGAPGHSSAGLTSAGARAGRRVRRTARRHGRLTIADQVAFWQAARRSRGRYGRDWSPRVRLMLAVMVLSMAATAAAILFV